VEVCVVMAPTVSDYAARFYIEIKYFRFFHM
jgi:hypothetical protein